MRVRTAHIVLGAGFVALVVIGVITVMVPELRDDTSAGDEHRGAAVNPSKSRAER